MNSLVSSLGVNPSSNLSVFLFCTIFTFSVVTILWLVGLLQGNHSMMDGWYGFAFAVPALLAYLIVGAQSVTAALLLFMVMLHGGRLGWYLAARWRRYVPVHGGDPRYLNFVKEMTPGYWWKSFFRVMEPQAVIIVLIGMPAVVGILANRAPNGGIGPVAFIGLLVFMVGLYFETVADAAAVIPGTGTTSSLPEHRRLEVQPPPELLRYHHGVVGHVAGGCRRQPHLLVDRRRPGHQHHHADVSAGFGVPGQLHGRAARVSRADGPHPPIPAAAPVRRRHRAQPGPAGRAARDGKRTLRCMTPSSWAAATTV